MNLEASENRMHPSSFVEAILNFRSPPGIMILSHTLHLFFINREAQDLSAQINHSEHGGSVRGLLPKAITEFCSDIVRTVNPKFGSKDCEEMRLCKVIDTTPHPILVRGFCARAPGYTKNLLILILLERIVNRAETTAVHAKSWFNLSSRELAVLEHLAKGMTNKEIANELRTEVYKVKNHIKQIMRKTKSTNRTAVLSHLYSVGPEAVSHKS